MESRIHVIQGDITTVVVDVIVAARQSKRDTLTTNIGSRL